MNTQLASPSPFLTVRDIAMLFNVSGKTVYHWVASDPRFPVLRVGKHLRFDAGKVTKYFEEKTEEAKPACFQNPFSLERIARRSLKTKTARHTASLIKE